MAARTRISRDDLDWAAREGLIAPEQAGPLWDGLLARRKAEGGAEAEAEFDLPTVAYYLGAILVIVAMAIFMGLAWREFGGASLLALALVYGLVFLVAGTRFWRRKGTRVAGGLLLTLAVFMVPLAILGIQFMLGLWPPEYVHEAPQPTLNRLAIEAATLVAGLVMVVFVRFSFLALPIVAAAWLIAIDIVVYAYPGLIQRDDQVQMISVAFGLAAIAVSLFVDHRAREDYSFWGYFGGLLAFWFGFAGLTLFDGDVGPVGDFMFALVGVGAIFLSVLLHRALFLVFGSLAVLGWLFDVAYGIFEDSLLFPVVLSLIGLAVLWAGIRYHRDRDRIEAWAQARIPAALRGLAPPDRE